MRNRSFPRSPSTTGSRPAGLLYKTPCHTITSWGVSLSQRDEGRGDIMPGTPSPRSCGHQVKNVVGRPRRHLRGSKESSGLAEYTLTVKSGFQSPLRTSPAFYHQLTQRVGLFPYSREAWASSRNLSHRKLLIRCAVRRFVCWSYR